MHYNISNIQNLSKQIDAILGNTSLTIVERWIRIAGLAEHDERIAPVLRRHIYHELPRPAEHQAVLKALAAAERRRTGPLVTMMRNIAAYRSGQPVGDSESEPAAQPASEPEPQSIEADAPPISTTGELMLRVDPEIMRIATGLGLVPQCRLWALIRHTGGARGYVTLDALQQLLAEQAIHHSQRYLLRLLRKGAGLFWGIARNGRIFYRGAARVGVALVAHAKAENRYELYETNLPGGRDVWVPFKADLQEWKAYVYAAWFAWRQHPQIARSTLCGLFGVSKETLLNWENALPEGVLSTRHNDAQSAVTDPAQLPAHATQYMTWDKQIRYRWQTANTYISSLVVHAHKGQARRVRERAGREAFGLPVNAHQAHPSPGCWFDRSHRTLRRYHTSLSRVQRFARLEARIEARNGSPRGFRKQEMYLWRGTNAQGCGIYEYIPREAPFGEIPERWEPQTRADERVPLKIEYRRDWLGDYKRAEREYLRFLRAQGELA